MRLSLHLLMITYQKIIGSIIKKLNKTNIFSIRGIRKRMLALFEGVCKLKRRLPIFEAHFEKLNPGKIENSLRTKISQYWFSVVDSAEKMCIFFLFSLYEVLKSQERYIFQRKTLLDQLPKLSS